MIVNNGIIKQIYDLFNNNGFQFYLVGGFVRDMLLGVENDDIDACTDATPPEIIELVKDCELIEGLWTIGEQFGTIGIVCEGKKIEITTFRKEVYSVGSRKPYVEYGTSLLDDLARRDFTINAMAYDIETCELIDPFHGELDLRARRLRCPLNPETSFREDPLRMMRAARFIARFGMACSEDVKEAASAGSLRNISRERVCDEFCKLILLDDPWEGWLFLEVTGLLREFLGDVGWQNINNYPKDLIIRLAVLDVDEKKMFDLKFSNQEIDAVRKLIEINKESLLPVLTWTSGKIRRFVKNCGKYYEKVKLIKLASGQGLWADFLGQCDDLIAAEGQKFQPALDGNDVIKILGIKPGKQVGSAMKFLMDLRLDEGVVDEGEVVLRLKEWYETANV